jgi:ATP-dependent protease ClpP protease subunit
MNGYLNFRMQNKGKGDFRAEDNTIWIYDVIASDDMEAAWWGGIAPSAFITALAKTTGPVTLRINSPGGSVTAALKVAAEVVDGLVVAIVCDRGDRYISTGVYPA